MFVYDFNKKANEVDFIDENPNSPLKGTGFRVTKGKVPSRLERTADTYVYIPNGNGEVVVDFKYGRWTTNGPCTVLLEKDSDATISREDESRPVYSFQPLGIQMEGIEKAIESPAGLFLDRGAGVALYSSENRLFYVGTEKKQSAWFTHSLKEKPDGSYNSVGIADVIWKTGLRDNEVVHLHKASLEILIPLEGTTTMMHHSDSKIGSYVQEQGVMTIAEAGEVHGVIGVEGNPYSHIVIQIPSLFHIPEDRVIVNLRACKEGRMQEFTGKYGIPKAYDPKELKSRIL